MLRVDWWSKIGEEPVSYARSARWIVSLLVRSAFIRNLEDFETAFDLASVNVKHPATLTTCILKRQEVYGKIQRKRTMGGKRGTDAPQILPLSVPRTVASTFSASTSLNLQRHNTSLAPSSKD